LDCFNLINRAACFLVNSSLDFWVEPQEIIINLHPNFLGHLCFQSCVLHLGFAMPLNSPRS
jgi:hypothetical protein